MRMLLLVAALLGLVALTAPTAAQPVDDTVPKILEAWKKRQSAFKTAKYVVTGNIEHLYLSPPQPGSGGVNPKTPCELPYNATVLLDLEHGHYRIEQTEYTLSEEQGSFLAFESTRCYDGKSFFAAIRTGREAFGTTVPDVSIITGDLSNQQVGVELWPVFAAHGIVPTAQRPLRPDRLPLKHAVESFSLRGASQFNGANCTIVNSVPHDAVPAASDELWVDSGRNAFVARHIYYAGRVPFARLDVKSQVKAGAALPSEWTCTWMSGKRVRTIHQLQVTSVETEIALGEGTFTLAPKKGMRVEESVVPQPGSGLDPSRPAQRKYVMTSDERNQVASETGPVTLDGQTLPVDSANPWRAVGAVASVLVVVAFAVWLGCRRGRRLPGLHSTDPTTGGQK